jgi:hypothetical protein
LVRGRDHQTQIWFSGFGGEDLNVIFYQNMPNLHNRYKSLDGPLPKWCPAVALSRQDGHHSAVALLLKVALIQVSDYRLLGASGFNTILEEDHPMTSLSNFGSN